MGNTSPYAAPCRLVQGQTWSWVVSGLASTYPLSDWVLSYHFVSATPAKSFSLTATNDGTNFLASRTSTQTALLTPSDKLHGETGYSYQGIVTNTGTGEKHVVVRGALDLEADLSAQPAGYDPRSPAQKQYDELIQAIATVGSDQIASYTMADGRSVTYRDTPDLLKRLHNLERIIAMEARARELGCTVGDLYASKYQVRFSS